MKSAARRSATTWVGIGLGSVLLAGGAWWGATQFKASPATATASAPPTAAKAAADAIRPADPKPAAPSPSATYDELLRGQASDWRIARLALNPRILVIEFPNLASQGQALNRLAALVEKHKAPRDRVLSDEGLARFIQQSGDTPETFYAGHDYTAESVARFFTLAVNQQVLLNPNELRLGNLLLAQQLLVEENDRLAAAPGPQAVITFSALQADNPATKADETVDATRREAILRHELSHGEFFTNAEYRKHCWTFWQGLSDDERAMFRSFLTKLDYDPRIEELMVNETQAFLMHTPDLRAFDGRQLGLSTAQVDALRARFRQGMPASIFSSIGR